MTEIIVINGSMKNKLRFITFLFLQTRSSTMVLLQTIMIGGNTTINLYGINLTMNVNCYTNVKRKTVKCKYPATFFLSVCGFFWSSWYSLSLKQCFDDQPSFLNIPSGVLFRALCMCKQRSCYLQITKWNKPNQASIRMTDVAFTKKVTFTYRQLFFPPFVSSPLTGANIAKAFSCHFHHPVNSSVQSNMNNTSLLLKLLNKMSKKMFIYRRKLLNPISALRHFPL